MAETVAVIDVGSGNLRSAAKALERAAAEAGLATHVVVTSDPDLVAKADRLVLPGVGAFAACMDGLLGVEGLKDAIATAAIGEGRPFLGICVGMQLMAQWGVEFGRHRGLGWLAGEIAPLAPADPGLKIPHMGWNTLTQTRPHALLEGLANPSVYFVHSYALTAADPAEIIATCDYGGAFPAMVGRDNLAGTQFHPEKSQAAGLAMLGNFLKWRP
jgi:glutamine amidotransferase